PAHRRIEKQPRDLAVFRHGLIQMLDLLHPIYKETAAYGHFGREHFPWEKTDKAALLREAAGLK
ncbi:methionine adenosyltransferase domain-containing protein, partial [Klebsiella pneumoniae]|uniref:methionine adenosyltransferase domain-containing protein n=1 Tax=Klebsiella pneumoniae TaxID=573 RepID=UPI00396C0D58